MAVLQVKNIEKHFGATRVLEDISFELEQGQALAIIGSSGSGKTTLLRCLNFLETPDQGQILVQDKVLFDAADPSTQRESEIRKKRLHFGMVFQSFNLFPQYTALENVTLASQLLARERPDFKEKKKEIYAQIEKDGRELLGRMGLADRAGHYPHQLSGGQQQRVAIARALASEAPVILADEPTGNLDEDTAQDITEILKESAHKMNKCVVVVTHSNELAKQADVVFRLKKGELQVLERVQDGAAQPQSRRNNAPRSERRAH